ncbi:hypothetical protein [Candidatus Mycolicibacterium alkanivorans]|uniref:hypothetical protein n=1 Tax=Candidatus Mycolicibacterium alkanivorans TaxID=2954114 RepID=UPI001FAAF8ED|nr:hypothetical protein [Candidatus Mycolicibacterium alkanivorans]
MNDTPLVGGDRRTERLPLARPLDGGRHGAVGGSEHHQTQQRPREVEVGQLRGQAAAAIGDLVVGRDERVVEAQPDPAQGPEAGVGAARVR